MLLLFFHFKMKFLQNFKKWINTNILWAFITEIKIASHIETNDYIFFVD